MPGKIDPLNKKEYGAISAILNVSNLQAAVDFYKKALGFSERSMMKGPDGKPIHAELKLRDTTLMLSPENVERGAPSAKTMGGSPVTLFLLTEDVDAVVAKAVQLGATVNMPVMDMFWGDRCGTIADPNGYVWMVATHVAEPTEQEMAKKMAEQMGSMSSQTSGAGS